MRRDKQTNKSLQKDGNLVMYDAEQTALWASHTDGNSDQEELIVQDDLNVVLYLYDAGGKRVLWSTNTNNAECPEPECKFVFWIIT